MCTMRTLRHLIVLSVEHFPETRFFKSQNYLQLRRRNHRLFSVATATLEQPLGALTAE